MRDAEKDPESVPYGLLATETDQLAEREFIAAALRAESEAVASQIPRVGEAFHRAVDLLAACAEGGGSILVAGLGKSGLIGKKISATLASLGAPSHDIHPSEAAHGDLGRIRSADCLLALSHSGETEEVVALASALRQDGVAILSITGGEGGSSLARVSTVALTLGPIKEATDWLLAPTCSTTATLAIGDALALAVARRRAFSADDFARRHPGGSLGGLMRPITEALRVLVGRNLPVVAQSLSVRRALETANELGRRPGALLLVDGEGRLSGIFTDGDLRRLILRDARALEAPIERVMTRSPRSLPDSALVRDAVRLVREFRQDEIPVVDAGGRPVGLLDVQDLIAMKVVQD